MKYQKPLLIQNGHVIDPANGIDEPCNLFVAQGKIVRVSTGDSSLPDYDYDILDAEGMMVCPGFIDLHCHLRQPGYEAKETIATGSRAAVKGGFTTICCMPNTKPPLDNTEMICYVKSVSLKESPVSVLPIGCITIGRKGEAVTDMAELAEAGAVAFSDDGDTVMDYEVMKQALIKSKRFGLPVIDHCENKELAKEGQVNEGKIARKLKLKGIPAAAEESIIERDIELAGQTGGKIHIAHVSTEGSVELIRKAKNDGINITAEVTPHHLTMTEDMVLKYGTYAKVNPPLRTAKDVAALIQGLKDGTIDAIATDHAPHTAADKNCEFTKAAFGFSGFETAFGSLMTLVHKGEITLSMIIEKLTTGPANILGAKYAMFGSFSLGNPADITIFAPDIQWQVDISKFISKGKNTPLKRATLKGKVKVTIFNGKIVYKDI